MDHRWGSVGPMELAAEPGPDLVAGRPGSADVVE